MAVCVCVAGYLADTHTAVGLCVARKYRAYSAGDDDSSGTCSSNDIPVLVSATAHYSKCPDAVLLALSGSPPPSSAGTSLADTLAALQPHLTNHTRPPMHAGIRALVDSEHAQSAARVLPAQLDAISAHIDSLL